MPKHLIEAMSSTLELVEGKEGRLIARGEYGRVDVPTRNGRIYSKKLMEREIKRLEADLKARRIIGELDHPCLTSDDFRVLTADGWKEFRDVRVGDRVWSRRDGEAVLSEVTGITDEPYDGPAYHVSGRSMNATFTPAHKFLLVKRPDRNGVKTEEFVTLAEIAEHPERYGHHAVPKTAAFFAEAMPQVTIPGVQAKRPSSCKSDVSQPLVLDAELFAAFLGVYLAEGCCSADSVDNYDVCITQKTPWSKRFIYDEVLSKFPDGLEWRETKTGYALADQRLYAYLKPLGDVYSKRVPSEVKRMDADSLRELLYWFCIGDGRMVASDATKRAEMTVDGQTTKEALAEALRDGAIPFTRRDVFSVSEGLVRDLHECLVRSGGAGSIVRIDPGLDYEYAGHTIRAEDKVPLYQLHISQSANVWMDPRHLAIEQVHHEGHIYCLTTVHGSFYMEREGHAFWTGNSDGKTSLKRASHVLTGLYIDENGIVVGEAEILNTEQGRNLRALIEAKVQLGVSSRGVGSTQPASGEVEGEVVQDDFVLRTYDFVADPAVKTAIPKIYTEDVDENQPTLAEMFLDEFPEITEGLKKKWNEEKVGAETPEQIEERVRRDLSEAFEKRLVGAIASVREELSKELREELSNDPEVGAAKTVLAQVAEMVGAYRVNPDEAAVRDALKSKDLEVAERTEERDEAVSKARKAALAYHVERKIGSHPSADVIRKLLKGASFETTEEIDEKIEAILADLPKPEEGQVSEEEARYREENAELKGSISLLEDRVDQLTEKLRKAGELATRIDGQRVAAERDAEGLIEAREAAERELQEAKAEMEQRVRAAEELAEEVKREREIEIYKREKVAGLTNGRELLGLMEGIDSEAVVDRLVEQRGERGMRDSELERMREELARGRSAYDDSKLAPLNEEEEREDGFLMPLDHVRRLAGITED